MSWAISVQAAGPDWPQWRGPARDGHSADSNLLKQWPADGPKLAWKITGIGTGYSSVAVVGDRIYTMGDLDDSSSVIALNREDGKQIWTAKVGQGGAPGWGGFSGPRCTPTVDGDHIYALAQFGEMVCLNAQDGKEVWRKNYDKDFGAQRPEWGYTAAPLVDGKQVILVTGGGDGDVSALDKNTGELIWRCGELKDSIHYSSPIVAEIGGVRQYIVLTDSNVCGIAASDGKILWKATRHGNVAVIPTPIYLDGYVYVASGYDAGCNLFKITASDGKFSANEVYGDKKTMINHHGGVVLVGKNLYGYCDHNGWMCQDAMTGKVLWHEKGKLGKGSITYADGMLYMRAEQGAGTIVLAEASPTGFHEKGRFNQPDRTEKNSWPHPVVAGGKLYIRDQDELFCYDVQQ